MTECVVKPLRDVKVTGSKPAGTKNPTMLRVGVAQAGCDPRVYPTGSAQINKQKKNSEEVSG